jgi:uncharacterized Zn finger protein (UPF0148 family)
VSRCPECGAEFIDDDGESWPYCPVCAYEPSLDELSQVVPKNPVGYEFHRYLRDKRRGRA